MSDWKIYVFWQVLTESVRLTDDVNLREQTDEDGDVFHWWMHQAKRGVLAAQVKMNLHLLRHNPPTPTLQNNQTGLINVTF